MSNETVEINRKMVSAKQKTAIRCPFHFERTPSCAIDLNLEVFHCFGCGSTGSVAVVDRNRETLTVVLAKAADSRITL